MLKGVKNVLKQAFGRLEIIAIQKKTRIFVGQLPNER